MARVCVVCCPAYVQFKCVKIKHFHLGREERENERTKGGKRWIKKGREEDEVKEREKGGGRIVSTSLPSPGVSLGSILGLGDGRLH